MVFFFSAFIFRYIEITRNVHHIIMCLDGNKITHVMLGKAVVRIDRWKRLATSAVQPHYNINTNSVTGKTIVCTHTLSLISILHVVVTMLAPPSFP